MQLALVNPFPPVMARLKNVAAGVSPAVESGILPPGHATQSQPKAYSPRFPPGRMPSSTAGVIPAAATNGRLRAALPLALCSLLLAGCAVGPNYHPPKTEVNPAFANAGQTNVSTAQIAVDWWRGFNDDTLQRLVDQALAGNHDLRIATARICQARALHAQAVADELPVVTGEAGYTKSLSSQDASPFPLSRQQRELALFNLGFDATWELDIFGGVRRSIQAAGADLAAAQAGRQDVLVSLVAEVARNYFELRGAQHQLDVAKQNAQNQRETLELTVAKFNAGRATELDTAR